MSTIRYKLTLDSMVQGTEKRTVVYQMTNDELFNVDGDLARMCELFATGRKDKRTYSAEEIKQHLNNTSESFQKNPEQDSVIESALKLLKELKVIEHA